MRMYTLADKAISEDEFSRAVTICTGRKLSPHLVHTVFQVMLVIFLRLHFVLGCICEFCRQISTTSGIDSDCQPSAIFCLSFQIFDNDGDGLLSYQEFIAMMKDRVHRGLKSFSRQEGWTGFKRCVKQEVKSGSSS